MDVYRQRCSGLGCMGRYVRWEEGDWWGTGRVVDMQWFVVMMDGRVDLA